MVDRVLPAIGSAGFYELRAPFDVKILPNERYTCQAIRRISDYLANNEDPKVNIYDDAGLSESEYRIDLDNDEYIVSLQGDVGQWVYVPYRYLVKFPDINGIPYRTMAIAVGLPPLPVDIDYDFVRQAVLNTIQDTLGVVPSIEFIETSLVIQVSREKHDIEKTNRDAMINGELTDRSRYMKALQTINTLVQQKAALEQYIADNYVTP